MTERRIRNYANRSRRVKDLMEKMGYERHDAGSNTKRKLCRIIGYDVYDELASGIRENLPKRAWTKC